MRPRMLSLLFSFVNGAVKFCLNLEEMKSTTSIVIVAVLCLLLFLLLFLLFVWSDGIENVVTVFGPYLGPSDHVEKVYAGQVFAILSHIS